MLRHGGAWYDESPVALAVDRNYYLIAYRPREGKYIHFRVDRMQELRVLEDSPRASLPEGFDLAAYTRTIFDMHSGEPSRVTLELDQGLLNAAMDRFGQEARYRREGDRILVSAPPFSPGCWALGAGPSCWPRIPPSRPSRPWPGAPWQDMRRRKRGPEQLAPGLFSRLSPRFQISNSSRRP